MQAEKGDSYANQQYHVNVLPDKEYDVLDIMRKRM